VSTALLRPSSWIPAQAVQIGQSKSVEIGDPEASADPFERQSDRARLSHGKPDHADRAAVQKLLLLARDLVAVAVGAKLAEFRIRQQMDEPSGPRIVDPESVVLRRHTGKMRGYLRVEGRRVESLRGMTAGNEIAQLLHKWCHGG
jgi:hypothetical protein